MCQYLRDFLTFEVSVHEPETMPGLQRTGQFKREHLSALWSSTANERHRLRHRDACQRLHRHGVFGNADASLGKPLPLSDNAALNTQFLDWHFGRRVDRIIA